MLFQKALDSRSVVNSADNHMSLRGEGSKQLCDVGIDVFWRTAFLARVEEPLVVRHAVAELVYLFEFEVELRAVSSGRPCCVKIWNP